jgi:hypothetical protein
MLSKYAWKNMNTAKRGMNDVKSVRLSIIMLTYTPNQCEYEYGIDTSDQICHLTLCMYMNVYAHEDIIVEINMYMYSYISICTYTYIFIYIPIYVCICITIHIYISKHIYIYIYIHTSVGMALPSAGIYGSK